MCMVMRHISLVPQCGVHHSDGDVPVLCWYHFDGEVVALFQCHWPHQHRICSISTCVGDLPPLHPEVLQVRATQVQWWRWWHMVAGVLFELAPNSRHLSHQNFFRLFQVRSGSQFDLLYLILHLSDNPLHFLLSSLQRLLSWLQPFDLLLHLFQPFF